MAKRAMLALAKSASAPAASPADDDDGPTRTLIERAYAQLRDDIVEGRLAPGEKLRVEHLKHRYGVGAGTLREAITRLVSDALAVAEGQRGFRVAPIAFDDLEDLTRLRVHIEIDALRQSIRRGDTAWREQLVQVYDELSAVEQPIRPEHRRRWEQLNNRYHEALIAGGASPWTYKVLRLLSRHSERYRRYAMVLPDSGRDVHAEHREIFELAMAGQDARAALALEVHIRATPDLLLRALRDGVPVFQRGEAAG
jgi:DNA-binding GntR family transcriptional regulator